jgi:16S rRNA (cytosine1402-N4)-methyltransferase
VLAVDCDPDALARARERLGDDGMYWVPGHFGDPQALAEVARFRPDFVLLDLGVSSAQLDADDRGFSFRPGVPLDMRMDRDGSTAADLLNRLPESEVAEIFREYGDERRARRLAATIARRRQTRFATSDDLVNAIRAALGPRTGPSTFARLFQAVRIAVNDELGELRQALPALRDALATEGRLAVISYHSGEDRIVKHLFREWARECVCPPAQPVCTCRGRALGRLDPPKPMTPTPAEIATNPRARSARLRAFRSHGSA